MLSVLSLFTGERCLSEVVPLLPAQLRAYAVDIVVWARRWRMVSHGYGHCVNTVKHTLNYCCFCCYCCCCCWQIVEVVAYVVCLPGNGNTVSGGRNFSAAETRIRKKLKTRFASSTSAVEAAAQPQAGVCLVLKDVLWLENLREEDVVPVIRRSADLMLVYR